MNTTETAPAPLQAQVAECLRAASWVRSTVRDGRRFGYYVAPPNATGAVLVVEHTNDSSFAEMLRAYNLVRGYEECLLKDGIICEAKRDGDGPYVEILPL